MTSNSPQPQRLLTVREAAAFLSESRFTTYRKIATGDYPAVRIGTRPNAPLRIRHAELEELLQPVDHHGQNRRHMERPIASLIHDDARLHATRNRDRAVNALSRCV